MNKLTPLDDEDLYEITKRPFSCATRGVDSLIVIVSSNIKNEKFE